MWGDYAAVLGKGCGFPGTGSRPAFCSLTVGVETLMVSMGVSLVGASPSLDLVSSNQFVISCGHSLLEWLCPALFPAVSVPRPNW